MSIYMVMFRFDFNFTSDDYPAFLLSTLLNYIHEFFILIRINQSKKERERQRKLS